MAENKSVSKDAEIITAAQIAIIEAQIMVKRCNELIEWLQSQKQ